MPAKYLSHHQHPWFPSDLWTSHYRAWFKAQSVIKKRRLPVRRGKQNYLRNPPHLWISVIFRITSPVTIDQLCLFICRDVRPNNNSCCSSATWLTFLITQQSRDPCGVVLLHLLSRSPLIFPENLILCLRSCTKRLTQRIVFRHGATSLECEKTSEVALLDLWG